MSQRYLIWDFDGTLAELPGMWSGTLAEVVRRHGDCASATATDFRPFLQSGFPWHAPEILRTSERNADAWWGDLSPLLVNALVRGAPIGARRASELLPAVRAAYCNPSRWRVYDDVVPTLATLTSQGWRHVILSNHVPELPLIVAALGLAGYFDDILTSAETGVEKPNALAFATILDRLPSGSTAVMIGDSYDADVAGARNASIDAILVRRPDARVARFAVTLHDVPSLLPLP